MAGDIFIMYYVDIPRRVSNSNHMDEIGSVRKIKEKKHTNQY